MILKYYLKNLLIDEKDTNEFIALKIFARMIWRYWSLSVLTPYKI